ncbi:MAG: CPBP family intramembrane glutamic endopeptidase [Acholeplasmatales bacterium]
MEEQNKNSNNNENVVLENEKKEYTFDDLFENKPNTTEELGAGELSKSRSGLIIGVYFFLFVFLATVIQLVLLTIPSMTESYNSTEVVIQYLEENKAISYTSLEEYNNLENKDRVDSHIKGDYVILISKELLEGETFTDEFIETIFSGDKFTYNEVEIERVKNSKITGFFREGFIPTFDFVADDYFGFTEEAGIISNFIIYVIGIIVLVILSIQVLKVDFKVLNKKLLPILSMLGIGYLFMIGGNMISGLLSEILSNLLNYTADTSVNQEAINAMLISDLAPLMIFVAVVGAPIVEELVFRKAFFSLIKNQWVALVVSSLLFSLMHVVSETSFAGFFINLLVYGASGVALGFVYIYYKRNIYAPIFVHALSNLVSILIFYLFPGLV